MPSAQIAASPARTVLVVDDSRVQRRILTSSLRRWGYAVHEAARGDDALRICKAEHVDLVISDWMMPHMSGLDLCQAFRAMPRESYGYFILLTSKSGKDEVTRGLEIGADDFLSKPVNADELRARLRAGERILGMEEAVNATNRDLAAALKEKDRLHAAIDRDLEEARRLQHALVPDRFRRFDGAEVSLLLRPSGHIGGDLVGVLPAGPGRIGVYSIDVSGHGIASALVGARVASYFTAPAGEQGLSLGGGTDGVATGALAAVAGQLNNRILREIGTDHYVTLGLAVLDLSDGRLSLVQAGHPHPAIERQDGRIEFLGAGGLPIGLFPDAVYDEVETYMCPGDRAILCSDGVTECAEPGGAQMGELGLARLMHQNAALSGEAMLEALVWDLAAHAGDTDPEDDISAVMIDYRPEARRPAKNRSPELPNSRAAS